MNHWLQRFAIEVIAYTQAFFQKCSLGFFFAFVGREDVEHPDGHLNLLLFGGKSRGRGYIPPPPKAL